MIFRTASVEDLIKQNRFGVVVLKKGMSAYTIVVSKFVEATSGHEVG